MESITEVIGLTYAFFIIYPILHIIKITDMQLKISTEYQTDLEYSQMIIFPTIIIKKRRNKKYLQFKYKLSIKIVSFFITLKRHQKSHLTLLHSW